jgi:deoxycytidylate deaminase
MEVHALLDYFRHQMSTDVLVRTYPCTECFCTLVTKFLKFTLYNMVISMYRA